MAKDEINKEGKETLTKEEKTTTAEKKTAEEKKAEKEAKKAAKLEAKKEKAEAKKAELREQLDDLKKQILEEKDEKAKDALRKQRDDIAEQLDAIKKSKDGMTIPMAPLMKKRITACICVVLVIALLVTYVATGAVRHGLLSYFGVPQSTITACTITDADGEKHSVKVSTYNYYFALYYNNLRSQQEQYSQYGVDLGDDQVDFEDKLKNQTTTNDDGDTITWAQKVHDEVIDNIKNTYLYYYEAVKANDGKEPEITKDQKKELKETISSYKETANSKGFTVSGYLTAALGKGVDLNVFKREARVSYISENYKEEYQEKLNNKEYSNNDYNDYYKEHKSELQVVDVRYFECDSEDDAKAFVKALDSDASNFSELAVKYTSKDNKFDKTANADPVETTYKEITRSTFQSVGAAIAQADEEEESKDSEEEHEHTYSGLDWIYSSKRKTGDVKQVSTSVVYILKKAYKSDTKTVNVRHILISPLSKEDQEAGEKKATDATAKEWAAAEKKAKKILAEYKKGDKTAEAFGKLAKKNSTDSNADDGGLYENITPNQMVPTFNAWCFDSSRKEGDTGIVKTEYGYHIMYFESYGELPVWKYTAQQAMASDEGTKAQEKLEKSYKIKENWLGSRFFEVDTDIDY
ncbi:MAG: peptidylprolyl isomerase [Eubacterium sp.]|nr:peptidylprolyl isomerase [Eubacterium sp.]